MLIRQKILPAAAAGETGVKEKKQWKVLLMEESWQQPRASHWVDVIPSHPHSCLSDGVPEQFAETDHKQVH